MISKLFLKPLLSCLKGTEHTEIFCNLFTVIVFLLLAPIVHAEATFSLSNWRLPFYIIASEFEMSEGSNSRMFWDGIDTASVFSPILSTKNGAIRSHYCSFEPSLFCGISDSANEGNDGPYYGGMLYNKISFANITVRHLCNVDERYNDDLLYPAHPDRFARGRIEEATITAAWKHAFISIGRQHRNWGPFPDRSLLLSSNPYTYDAVELRFFNDFFEFGHLFAPLPSNRWQFDQNSENQRNRYLTAHSLNLVLSRWITVGFIETVLFTRNSEFPDLQYMNPVALYSVINTNQEGEGNLMLGFQWSIHPCTDKLSLRGQVILDDFQVDNELTTDDEPTHWGIDAGVYWYNPLISVHIPHLVKLEVTHASKWLYTVTDYNAARGERYTVHGRSLGLSENDFTEARLGCTAIMNDRASGEVVVSYRRRGGNTPRTSWQDANAIPGLPVAITMPVEKRVAAGMNFLLFWHDVLKVNLYGDCGWLHNRNNAASDGYDFDPLLAAELSIHYSDFFIKIP